MTIGCYPKVAERIGRGDVYLHLGYYSPSAPAYAAAKAAGATVVEILAAGPGQSEVVAVDGSVAAAPPALPADYTVDPGGPPCPSSISLAAAYDAFGLIETTFRELDWKTHGS